MKRSHSMPFGAEIVADGQVRFRLWAPSAKLVDLCLEDIGKPIAMTRLDQGWFEMVTARAESGSDYRFRIDADVKVPNALPEPMPAETGKAALPPWSVYWIVIA